MNLNSKDVAKFFAGMVTHEMIGHAILGTWASHLLPMKLGFFTFTPELNIAAMVGWGLVLIALVHYAWFREAGEGEKPGAARPAGA
jgi:hypothetical protein